MFFSNLICVLYPHWTLSIYFVHKLVVDSIDLVLHLQYNDYVFNKLDMDNRYNIKQKRKKLQTCR